MGFLLDPIFWVISAVCLLLFLWSEVDDRRRMRRLLEAVDKEWNECVNRHHKTIAEAYQRGEQVHITMDRR